MSKFRLRLPWLVAAVAILVASGAFASNVFGSDPPVYGKSSVNAGPDLKMSSHKPDGVTSHNVPGGIKFVNISVRGTVEPGQAVAATGTCPRVRPHPISGFFNSNNPAVALTTSTPASSGPRNRRWRTGVSNFGAESAEVTVGTICAK